LSTKYRRLFSIFTAILAVALCVAVPLVTYLILYSIDPSTHFYYDNAKLVNVTNGILIALTVILLLPVFTKRAGAYKMPTNRKPVISVVSLLTAVVLCLASVYSLAHSFSSKVGVGNFLSGILGILAAIFFFAFAEAAFTGKHTDLRMIALLPVLWGIVKLISTFMSLTQIANISEYLYEVLQMVFAILFLYYNARLVGNVSNRREINGVFAFGLPCAFFGLLATLPKYIAHIINPKFGSLPQVGDTVLIMLSVYIIVLLIYLLVNKTEYVHIVDDKPENNVEA
jgi:hypothetical protein